MGLYSWIMSQSGKDPNPGHSSISSQSFANGWALIVKNMNIKKLRYFIFEKKKLIQKIESEREFILVFILYDFISYKVKMILRIRF